VEEVMPTDEQKSWEYAKVEYEIGLGQYQLNSSLRRQDMAFVTTVQAAVLTITGSKLLSLDFSGFLLSAIAFFVLLLGLNSERRLAGYMEGYMLRARQIEAEYGMTILSHSWNKVKRRRLLFSNAKMFPIYYCIFILAWLIIWMWNLLKKR
jgi:hypothetical protein